MTPITLARVALKSPRAEADELELASRLARGEPHALEELIEHFGARVTGLAARLLAWSDGADDVAQDVFLTVWKKPHKFRGDSQLWTYLAAITVNRCRTLRRRAWLKDRVWALLGSKPANPTERPATERQETAQTVRQAIDQLPDNYREVIVLRYLEELGLDEIARILQLKRNTVEVRLTRARGMLEKQLKHLADEV